MNKLNKKILLIEDDEFLSEMLVKKFSSEGFNISLLKSAIDALEFIKTEKVNLILLDIILPGMDGFEFLKIIKENDKTKDIPVIVLSNLGQDEEIKRAKELGAEDYMVKAHFFLKEIVDKVDKMLAK